MAQTFGNTVSNSAYCARQPHPGTPQRQIGFLRNSTKPRAPGIQTTARRSWLASTSGQGTTGFLGFNCDLEEQLSFYGSYHSNPYNAAIHFVFVPAILWTVAVWLAYTPPLFHVDLGSLFASLPACCTGYLRRVVAPPALVLLPGPISYLTFNASFVLLAAYSLYYILLEPVAGTAWAALVALPMWATANAAVQHVGCAWGWATGLHLASWFIQVHFGHTVFEGRRPALLDSFFQSLVLAPLFVFFELLFLLGYRRKLAKAVQVRVAANITSWKKQQSQEATGKAPLQNKGRSGTGTGGGSVPA